jgi:hypothetical protein
VGRARKPSGITSPFNKRLGPDGKTHEGWCLIFKGECCSCDDDGRRRGRRRPVPLSGAPAAKRHLEDA